MPLRNYFDVVKRKFLSLTDFFAGKKVRVRASQQRECFAYSFATLPPQLKIFAFVPAASASLMLPARL